MREISVFDDAIFGLLEELYRLNNRSWKKRILLVLMHHKQATYKMLKEELIEVSDLLAYRCIQELVQGQVIRRIEEQGHITYCLENDQRYLKEILAELKDK